MVSSLYPFNAPVVDVIMTGKTSQFFFPLYEHF